MDETEKLPEANDLVDVESADAVGGSLDESEASACSDAVAETATIGDGDDSDRDEEIRAAEFPPAVSLEAGTEPEDPEAAVSDRTEHRNLEELSVADFIGLIWQSPLKNLRRLKAAAYARSGSGQGRLAPALVPAMVSPESAPVEVTRQPLRIHARQLFQRKYAQLALYTLAIASALVGSAAARGAIVVSSAGSDRLAAGAPFLWLGFLLWLGAEIVAHLPTIRRRWSETPDAERLLWIARLVAVLIWIHSIFVLAGSMVAPVDSAVQIALSAGVRFLLGIGLWIAVDFVNARINRRKIARYDFVDSFDATGADTQVIVAREAKKRSVFSGIGRLRGLLVILAVLSSVVVWQNTTENYIDPPIIALWISSAALWGFVFAPLDWNIFELATRLVDRCRRIRWHDHRLVVIAMVLILILGAGFRFSQLDTVPSELFSDLVEKIQDAYRIRYQDDYRIFLANIGGREPLHFYMLSILASQPGMEFGHYALKLMSALESFVTIPLMFWLGVAVMGERRRGSGILLGLIAAGLVAVSYWHVVIGRQGMRISLAPLFVALTAIFYLRALRYNRRADFVLAGLALGFGLYAYQAIRMLPVPIVAGVLMALVIRRYSWRTRLSYLLNLAVLSFVSLMVFLPMLHYWVEFPEDYQRRTSTRIFGDLPTTEEERSQALLEGGAVLLRNIRNVLLVFNHTSDSTWVSSASGEPGMDTTTAAFMILGVAVWLVLIVSTRDPAMAAVPILVFFMLLASALSLAFPVEVPSFARASGAIPPSYLMAALPVCIYSRHLYRVLPRRLGTVAAVGFVAAVILAANYANTSTYFGPFSSQFARSSHPYAQAGQIVRGFAESDGAYGNAIMLGSPHWWDYRAVGIEAGVMFWDNGTNISQLPAFLGRGLERDLAFRLDPERDLLFFYAKDNSSADAQLGEWFPGGRSLEIEAHQPGRNFYVYRVPALGAAGLQDFIQAN